MGRGGLCFKIALLLSVFLVLLCSNGFGRKMVSSSGSEEHANDPSNKGMIMKSREMMELDYEDAGPNVNAKSGFPIPSPPPPPGLGY